jgi:hypothetical protein
MRSASVCEMYSPRSPSKPPPYKGLSFLKARLHTRRDSHSSDKERPSSRLSLRSKEQTPSANSQFVGDLLHGGKTVPRFQKRMPTMRTAVRKYESVIFRQRFMALPEEVRNQVYDYVIAGDTEDGGELSENCRCRFVDCSRGVISHDIGDGVDFEFLDDVGTIESSYELHTDSVNQIPVLLQSRPYSASSLSSLSSHTSCSSPSTCYSTRRFSNIRPSMPSNELPEIRRQYSSQERNLIQVYHVNGIPTTWPRYVRRGDEIWKELISRWIRYDNAKVHFEDHLHMFEVHASQNDDPSAVKRSELEPDVLPPLFAHVSQDSLLNTTILQQTHSLHLALTIHEMPLVFSSPHRTRTDSLFSIHETEGENHPLIDAVHHITSSLKQMTNLTCITLTLNLYPGPLGDKSFHRYKKYFTTLEEVNALWYMLAPLKSVDGIETIVVKRLGSCVRWGRRRSSLFPEREGVSVIENEGFPSNW